MRFLIINTDYPDFLRQLYARNPGLEHRPYQEQLKVRNDSLFGVSDFYPRNLRLLGHEAEEVHVNNTFLQRAWASEHRVKAAVIPTHISSLIDMVRRRRGGWFCSILEAQIRHYRPDVIVNHAIGELPSGFWKQLRSSFGLLVGQLAAPIPPSEDFHNYDLMLSSLPNFVSRFRLQGVKAELFRLGFDPRVLKLVGEIDRDISVSFVGSLSMDHKGRMEWLERLCNHVDVRVWGPGVAGLPANSAVRKAYQGEAWGAEMYRVLRRSRLTLNYHIGIAEDFANNMRLYEATGVGACLVTDWKQNLGEMFGPGKEVLAYKSTEECIELIRHHLDHDAERTAVANAGHDRTLREHTYLQRMQELVEIVKPRLRAR